MALITKNVFHFVIFHHICGKWTSLKCNSTVDGGNLISSNFDR